MNSELIERLKKYCEWWRADGTPKDNGYPHHKHFPNCIFCQAIAELERLEKENAELQQAEAKQEAIERAQRITDPLLDPTVRWLCEGAGYGAVMDSAMRQWILKDSMGAFYIGGCLAHPETIERLQEQSDE